MRNRVFLAAFCCLIWLSQSSFIFKQGIGIAGGGPGILNVTFTIVNDSGSATTGGTPTQTFGWPFLDGDLCSGAGPVFKIGGVTQPYSASPANARRYWPSGCLMFASFMLKPTVAVSGSGSATVTMTAGNAGSWPSASSRTTTELYAQNLVFNAPATGTATFPDSSVQITATLGSWLDSAANTNNNNMRQTVWLDGDAGKCWRVTTKMSPTKTGSGDVSMRFNHYVCALNNASGTLGGFRWLGQMRNPVYDNGSPPKAHWFHEPDTATPTNGVNWTVCAGVGGCVAPAAAISGSTPIYTPYQTLAATVQSGGGHCTDAQATTNLLRSASANGFYAGAGGYNMVPVYNKTTSQAYFASSISGTDFQISNGASGPCGTYWLGNSPPAGTYAPAIFIDAFERINVATKDAKYNFFQGTGSIADETTLRVKINQTYWQSSKVFFPFDLHYQGVNNPDTCGAGSGCSNTAPEVATGGNSAWTYDWTPYSVGSASVSQSDAGDHPDIGFLMRNGYSDFYNQTALSEKVIRIEGLGAGMYMHDLRDGATDNILLFDNGTYTGMPANNAFSICWSGAGGGPYNNTGWNFPSNAIQQPVSIAISFDHKSGQNLPWAYARTGELQYLDMIVDQFEETWLTFCGDKTPNPTMGTYFFVATNWTGSAGGEQTRYVAWAGNREVQYAALFFPFDPNNPTAIAFDGTQTGLYINLLADNSSSYPMDQLNNSCAAVYGAACSYITTAGRWSINNGAILQRDGPIWENAYVVGTQIIAAIRHLGDTTTAGTKARDFVKLWGQRLKYEGDTEGYYHIYSYYSQYGLWAGGGSSQHIASSYYSTDDQYAISQIGSQWVLSWTNSGARRFTFTSVNVNGWTPANCDVIMNWIDGNHPPEMTDGTPYYLTGGSGLNFNMTADKANCAGSPTIILPSNNGAGMSFDYRARQSAAPTTTWPYVLNYVSALRSVSSWAKAIGLESANGGHAAVISDANFRMLNNVTQSGPAGACPCAPDDVRYYTQDHFGP